MKRLIILMSSLLLLAGCSSEAVTKPEEQQRQTFAEAHDAFKTKLTKQESDQDPVPEPPAGVFELKYYDSKVGELAAYVSSDPADGKKHPMIIWIVGGWGNGIDEFAWSYPDWENDQTASAFREAGILMMYPSFRGGNGNPGYYETLFGEVDDIVSAYEYAAALPYVDPERIYLGGHSTGGTRALLASEYTDKFRAVFAFGPVDEVKYHNNTQFTFDTGNQEEYRMRSPINWLKDVKSPTYLIEGEGGNAKNLKAIQEKSANDNIHCYIVDDADHFSVLAPITRLLAEKISSDTDTACSITLTDAELQTAMAQPPVTSYPIMVPFEYEDFGLRMEIPAIWECSAQDSSLSFRSLYSDDNFWDRSEMAVELFNIENPVTFDEFVENLSFLGDDSSKSEREVNGEPVYLAGGLYDITDYGTYFIKVAGFQQDDRYLELWFYIPEEYQEDADVIFEKVIESVTLS